MSLAQELRTLRDVVDWCRHQRIRNVKLWLTLGTVLLAATYGCGRLAYYLAYGGASPTLHGGVDVVLAIILVYLTITGGCVYTFLICWPVVVSHERLVRARERLSEKESEMPKRVPFKKSGKGRRKSPARCD